MKHNHNEHVVSYRPIGLIHTPHQVPKGTPIQPRFAEGIKGTVEVFKEYAEGLKDVEGFDRLWLVYHFDRIGESRLRVVPYMDTVERGLFATRAPCRPNPIGISCVRLLSVQGNVLTIADVDILDGTPLLDIKPYVRRFDCWDTQHDGWQDGLLAGGKHARRQADGRFH